MQSESKNMKKTVKGIGILLYVAAIVFGAYSIFAIANTAVYIHELVSVQSLDLIDNMGDVIAYFASSCGSYIFYAVVCAALGAMVSVAAESMETKEASESVRPVEEEKSDQTNDVPEAIDKGLEEEAKEPLTENEAKGDVKEEEVQ